MESCYVTIVGYECEKEFRGVFDISGDEISVSIEYGKEEGTGDLHALCQWIEDEKLVNLWVTGQDGSVITCLDCFSLTPFLDTCIQQADGKYWRGLSPMHKFGLIEFFCNRWIENVSVESSRTEFWKNAVVSFPDVDRWFADAKADRPIPISEDGTTVSFESVHRNERSFLTMVDKMERKGRVSVQCVKEKSQEDLFGIERCICLLLEYSLACPMGPGRMIVVMKNSDGQDVECECHYRPIDRDKKKPDMKAFLECKPTVKILQEEPQKLRNWFDCCDSQYDALHGYERTLESGGYIDEKIMWLVQSFDSLSQELTDRTSVDKNAFSAWVNAVGIYGASLSGKDVPIGKDRIIGVLGTLRFPSLKARLMQYMSVHVEKLKPLKREDVEAVAGRVVTLRHSRAHGHGSRLDELPKGYGLLELETIMQKVVRILIDELVFS